MNQHPSRAIDALRRHFGVGDNPSFPLCPAAWGETLTLLSGALPGFELPAVWARVFLSGLCLDYRDSLPRAHQTYGEYLLGFWGPSPLKPVTQCGVKTLCLLLVTTCQEWVRLSQSLKQNDPSLRARREKLYRSPARRQMLLERAWHLGPGTGNTSPHLAVIFQIWKRQAPAWALAWSHLPLCLPL